MSQRRQWEITPDDFHVEEASHKADLYPDLQGLGLPLKQYNTIAPPGVPGGQFNQATQQDASMEQQVDNLVSNMTVEQMREIIRDTVINTMQDYFSELSQNQEQQNPAPEQAQEPEPDIASLMADMSVEDIQEVLQQFIEEQQQEQEAANDNSQQPDGDDPSPPSSLRQYMAGREPQHEQEYDQEQQRAITY